MAHAVGLVGVDLAELGVLHAGVILHALLDLVGQRERLGLQIGVVEELGKFCDVAQLLHGEQVRRDKIAVHTGVVAGAEAAPGHAGAGDGRALALVGEGVAGRAVVVLKAIGALIVILLGAEHVHDGAQHFGEHLGHEAGAAGLLVEAPGQQHGMAEGIDLILALPDPVGGAGTVVVGLVVRGFAVVGVGVGIQQHVPGLTGDQPLDQFCDLLIVGEAQVVQHLSGGIAQPHGVDVAGDHERVALGGLYGGLQGVHEALLEDLPDLGIVLHHVLQRLNSVANHIIYHRIPPGGRGPQYFQ